MPKQKKTGSLVLQWQDRPEGADAEYQRFLAHKQRCKDLPPVSANEAEQLIEQFLARKGGVTQCPTAYLIPIR